MNRLQQMKPLVPMAFALLYGASPIDLIPDLIPLLGIVDDAIVVPALIVMGIFQLRKNKMAVISQRTIAR